MKPKREHTTRNAQAYFVTSETWGRRPLFRPEPWARLFCRALPACRGQAYLPREFVLMPEHFNLLITPMASLERAVQFVKGGFSYRVKKELGSNMEVWQRGFSDHRIRNAEDYAAHVRYIHQNPVKRGLSATPEEYPCCSAYSGWRLDPVPQGLKPLSAAGGDGTAEAVPLQSTDRFVSPHESDWFNSPEDSGGLVSPLDSDRFNSPQDSDWFVSLQSSDLAVSPDSAGEGGSLQRPGPRRPESLEDKEKRDRSEPGRRTV